MRRRPEIYSALLVALVLATVALAEAGWIGWQTRVAQRTEKQIVAREREIQRVLSGSAARNEEELETLDAAVSDAEAVLAAWRDAWSSELNRVSAPDATTATPEEVFFELATFVETMRREAARYGVGLRNEERFGFASYAQAGPAVAEIARVRCERVLIERVLTELFPLGTREFVGVERVSLAGNGDGDSDRVVVRVSFVAQTATLRSLLNRLARPGVPLVVRDISVEPVVDAPSASGGAVTEANAIVPLVRQTVSRFTIEVEGALNKGERDANQQEARSNEN